MLNTYIFDNFTLNSMFLPDAFIKKKHALQYQLLSHQPRVTVTSYFVYKVIRDLESIDHLCINPIIRIGLIHKLSVDSCWLK